MKNGNNENMEIRNLDNQELEISNDVKCIISNWLLAQKMTFDEWEKILKQIGIIEAKKYYSIPLITGAFGFTAIKAGREKTFRIILAECTKTWKLTLETNRCKEFYEYVMANGRLILTHVYYETRNRIFNMEVTNSSVRLNIALKPKAKEHKERHYFKWEFIGRPVNVNLIVQNWKSIKRFFLRLNRGVNFVRAYKRILVISGIFRNTMMPLEKISFTHLCFANSMENIIQKLVSYDGQFTEYIRREIEGIYILNSDGTYKFIGDDENFEKEVISRMEKVLKRKP